MASTQVYVYGSGECDQLGLGDIDAYEIKKARKVKLELSPGVPLLKPIVQIACGGMHTVALASNGIVLSWGCNDDGALGRSGQENTPLRVDGALNMPVDGITCGDCHTIAYNTEQNKVFFWGCYKAVVSGKRSVMYEKPTRIAQEIFGAKRTKSKVKKIVSGQQHTLALGTDGKVFGWGDPEAGKIGRVRRSREDEEQDEMMRIQNIGAKKATDIFVGNQHSFYVNEKKQVYSWGLNNHGQLGLGSKLNMHNPSRVKELDPYEDDYVTNIVGGEHHSIAVTKEGAVYCFGRNDEAQMGCGNLFEDYMKAKKESEAQKAAKAQQEQPAAPESSVPDQPQIEEKKKAQRTKTVAKKDAKETDELKYIAYFYRPTINHFLWKIEPAEGEDPAVVQKKVTSIAAAGQYSYAIVEDKNEVYSWGFGENYVLGTLQDENEPKPHCVNPKMWEERRVFQMALGTQHVVSLAAGEGSDGKLPPLNMAEFELTPGALPPNDDEDDKDISKLPSPKRSKEQDIGAGAKDGFAGMQDKLVDPPVQSEIAEKKRSAEEFLQRSQPGSQPAASQEKRLKQPTDVVMAAEQTEAQMPAAQQEVDQPVTASADEIKAQPIQGMVDAPVLQVPPSNQKMAGSDDEQAEIQKEPVADMTNMPAEAEGPAKLDENQS